MIPPGGIAKMIWDFDAQSAKSDALVRLRFAGFVS
jgi:hypothetical protein